MITVGVISPAVSVSALTVGHSRRAMQVAGKEHMATSATVDVSVRTVHTVTQWTDHASALMATMEHCETQFNMQCMHDSIFAYDSCDQLCPYGTYGSYCRGSCGCQNDGVCSYVDGSCSCLHGWHGASCELKCDSGFYGDRCRQQCLCLNGATCDHVHGSCTCTEGWLGDNCTEKCSVSLIACVVWCVCV